MWRVPLPVVWRAVQYQFGFSCRCNTFLIILLILTGVACRNSQGDQSLRPVVIQLDSTQPQRRTLSTNERHTYSINLANNQYLRLRLEQNGVDVGLTLYGPDGRQAAEYEGRADGQAAISQVVEKPGEYRLETRALEIEALTGSYELKIEEIRTATSHDKERVAGEREFADGERLRARSEAAASKDAIKKYKEAEVRWRDVGQIQDVARALKTAGEIHLQLGDTRRALAHYEQALSLLQTERSAELESETLSDISYTQIYLGDYFRALDYGNQALSVSRVACDQRREVRAFLCLSEVYYNFGNRWKALEYARWAFSLCRRIGDRRMQAQALLSLGYIYTDLGETQQATDHLDQAFALYRAVQDRRGQALTRAAIASLKVIAGEGQLALTLYEEARTVIKTVGDRYWEASLLQNTGTLYQYLGDQETGLSYFNQARHIWHEIENPAEEAGALSVIGWLHYLAGDNQRALAHFLDALSMSEALSDKRYQSNALRKIGTVYNTLGDKGRAISFYRRALALHRTGGERQGEAYALKEIGKLYRSLRRIGQARTHFHQALAIDRIRGDKFAESETLYQLAGLEADGDRLTTARSHTEAALTIIESLRANVASHKLRVTYFASIQRYFEFFMGLLMRQHQQHPTAGFDTQALEVSERTRARSLIELLSEISANIRQGTDPTMLDEVRKLQEKIGLLAERKVKLLDAKAPASELASITKSIDDLSTQRDSVETMIRMKSPRYAALIRPEPMSAQEIQQMFDGDTMLLEFSLGEKRSYVWVVTQNDVKAYELPGRSEIEKAAREVYGLLAPPESSVVQSDSQRKAEFNKKANALSQLILQPVANDLGNKRLVIVAEGILQYIPFSVLPKPQTAKLNGQPARDSQTGTAANPVPMIYDHEIVNLPSASTLAVIRRETGGRKPAPKAVAVVADPVFDASDLRLLSVNGRSRLAASNQAASDSLSQARESLTRGGSFKRLYGTLEEARAIEELTNPAERFIAKDFDADLKRATSPELSHYRIIHFATHGVLDGDNPNLSALVFSLFDKLGKPQNGYLYLHDIYNLNLPAELVVLSACDTALGKEFKGEGLVGLTRGFMYAGAPRVMASLWKVGDEPTAKLMREFYRYHLKDGLPPAAALRQAQIKLYQDADWNAPYYWGSFVLQGEWK